MNKNKFVALVVCGFSLANYALAENGDKQKEDSTPPSALGVKEKSENPVSEKTGGCNTISAASERITCEVGRGTSDKPKLPPYLVTPTETAKVQTYKIQSETKNQQELAIGDAKEKGETDANENSKAGALNQQKLAIGNATSKKGKIMDIWQGSRGALNRQEMNVGNAKK